MTAQHVAFLSNQTVSVPQGGLYWCRGGRGNPVYYTNYSDPVGTDSIWNNLNSINDQLQKLDLFSNL